MSKQVTNQALSHEYKRTKIIATVGPATNSYEAVKSLIKNGVDGVRLNFSHGTNAERDQQIPWVRKASQELGKQVAIIQDLQGPKIRLGDFAGTISVQKNQTLRFGYKADWADTGIIPTQYDLSTKMNPGERLYLFDGKVRCSVTSVKNGIVSAKAMNDGTLVQRKGLNLPDTDFRGDVITEKDKADLAYGSKMDIDYVAMSFVQTTSDLQRMRKLISDMGSPRKLISKIETQLAVENIEEIVEASDAVMVARGDLAVETQAESVPIVQQQIIGLGLKYGKPTIVATQMLASMNEAPEPTRAEVSDIATAVLVGADCVMLSDETASGQYPIEAVSVMQRVICYTQSHLPVKVIFPADTAKSFSRELAVSRAVISLAENIAATAIVAETKSGATALQIAVERPAIALVAVTDDPHTAQALAIVYGIQAYVRPAGHDAAAKLTDFLFETGLFHKGDRIVTTNGSRPGVAGTTNTIKVRELE